MTTVQIASDLHIEYKQDTVPNPSEYITPSADILVLAGDIGSLYKYRQLEEFLTNTCRMFKAVLYVPGNHEWYEIPGIDPVPKRELERRLHCIKDNIPNLFILDKSSVLVGDICFVGCTLWSEPLCHVPRFIVRMENMNMLQYQQCHRNDIRFLENMMTYCTDKGYKLVVITHYPPSFKTLIGTRRRKKYLSLYASQLDHLLIKSKVHTWIYGHTHTNHNFISEGGTYVVCNQKGKAQMITDDYSDKFTINIY